MGNLTEKLIVAFDTTSLAVVRIFLPAVERDMARLAGAVFGAMGLVVSPDRRKRTLENLQKVLPNLSQQERRRISRECFLQFGAGFAETFHLNHKKRSYLKRLATIEGQNRLRSALAKGRGVVIIGSHLSNFPLGMLALSGAGYPVAVLVRQADNPRVEEMSNDIRRNFGLSWIYVKPRREAARKCIRWLQQGNILWILVDQRSRDGIVVKFLGHLSQVAPGAALFAQRLGSPALPAVTVRMDNSRYRVIIGDEIPLVSSNDRNARLRANMERFLETLAPHILAHPGQWAWFHKMWKVRKEALPT